MHVYKHGVILLTSFVEAGVKVHGSTVTFAEHRWWNDLWNAYGRDDNTLS